MLCCRLFSQPALLLVGGFAISLIVLLIVILAGAVGMITSLIGFAYPTYQSFKVRLTGVAEPSTSLGTNRMVQTGGLGGC